MRILTVRQPWAWAIVHGGKDVENRVRNIAGTYRGPVAIHAGMTAAKLTQEQWHLLETRCEGLGDYFGGEPIEGGAIIGVVDLVDVHQPLPGEGGFCGDTCSPWAEPDAHHLVLANPRPLARSIPFKGALGLRTLDDDTTARVLAALTPTETNGEQRG